MMNLQVETYPGHASAEMIRRFYLGGRAVEVIENLDQWHGLDYRYFKIKADDGNIFILRFDETRAEWDLTMFQSQPRGGVSKVLHAKT
jgi:hypothetical protein